VLTVLVTARLQRPSLGAAVLVATCLPLVFWSLSGNEATAQALLSALWILTAHAALEHGGRRWWWVVTALVASLLLRPENSLVLLTASALLIGLLMLGGASHAEDRRRLHSAHRLLMMTLVGAALLTSWRYWMYADVLPQPAVAKVNALSASRILEGARYLWTHAAARLDCGLWILALLGGLRCIALIVRRRKVSQVQVLASALLLAQFAFMLTSGGDWMAAGRFLVPALPPAALLAMGWLESVRSPLRRGLWAAVLCLQVFAVLQHARFHSSGVPLWVETPAANHRVEGASSWFERRNRSRVHDLVMREKLGEVLQRLVERSDEQLIVLSGQAGMVTFYTMQQLRHRIRFVDRFSLVTRDFSDCSVFDDLPRTQIGVDVRYPALFDRLEAAQSECGLPVPDVIWDWDSRDGRISRLIERQGYTLVYQLEGVLESGSRPFPGQVIRVNEFIAVRSHLVREDDLRERVVLDR
jgi:hypothetical protein